MTPDFINDLVASLAGGTSLEIGCGRGLFRNLPNHIGTDVLTDEYFPGVPRKCDVCCDAMELPFREGSFDLVFGMSVINEIPDPDKAIREAHRVLRPGGRLLIITYDWWTLLKQRWLYPHKHAYTLQDLCKKIESAGFTPVVHWPPLPPGRDWIRRVLYRLPLMDRLRNWRQCWRIVEGRIDSTTTT